MDAPVLVIVADDLSGAAETAGAVAAVSGSPTPVWLGTPRTFDAPVVAVDTASRYADVREATRNLAVLLDCIPHEARVYKKVDSLLRGRISAELSELRLRGTPVVVATAVPRIGRTVRDGVVRIGATPLHESGLWHTEARPPPSSIAECLGVPCALMSLNVVRSGLLDQEIAAALTRGLVPVCDADTEADLDLLAAALTRLDPRIVVLGAAGLVRSIASNLGLLPAAGRLRRRADRVVTVVGTRAPSASAQVSRLVAGGAEHVEVQPEGPRPLPEGDSVITFADGAWNERAFATIARAIRDLPGRSDLVLTGGDTARRTLDALGIDRLLAEREIEEGAVLSTTPDGLAVVCRPGSYGGEESLVQIARHLKGVQP